MDSLDSVKNTTRRKWALSVSIVAFLLFIYPTPYHYVRNNAARVNRFTGVQEISTDSGWKTDQEFRKENEAKETALRESKDAEDKALRASIADEFRRVKFDDERCNYTKIAVYNPTAWEFTGHSGSVSVEFFIVRSDGTEKFLSESTTLCTLRPEGHTDIDLYRECPYLDELPKGTVFRQKVTLTFYEASDVRDLSPGLVLSINRDFTHGG